MECPECQSTHIRKNGKKKGKQNHICVDCGRQFIDHYSQLGYSNAFKRECLKMYVNGMGFRAIERVKGVHHTTVITWVKQVGALLPDAYEPEEMPQVGELDELQTFVGAKKNKVWLWTAVDHFQPGILAWTIGDRSAETFKPLWAIVSLWRCFFYVTDGWKVYPIFVPDGDQIISKTYMTRVEGENTRLRHYLARLHRKTLCYSKSVEMLEHSIRLLIHYLKFWDVPIPRPS
ncbi:Insertion element protein [[Leptolyngbya] sp. PCC 7376]|uniref:IS1 family transposase n=1 Tax=[Leptolyngbya] sp. PCC 7376 TaxID=111781 RepID=UPI00029ED27B|nr:IS1 family transposase [[Leptolyngbya] sp. PCC 7376]AFY37058.1 Insertion element protein [[Leptolyngbya] sp. PCC 7376]